MQGPTQTAEWGAADRWRSRTGLSRLIKLGVFLAPIILSFGLSWWASKNYPPERVGLNIWVWWLIVASLAISVMVVTDKLVRRFLPLAGLLTLSLVFPDEAPSRFKQALRTGTTRQLERQLKHHKETGHFTDDTSYGEYLLELARQVGDHDRLTRGHSERVRAYTDLIAEELGLAQEDREKLHWAALLHDVGKLDVPSEVLNKSTRPNEEEWKILQTHPAAAVPYLEPLAPWLGQWIHAAEEHHLRWDGGGYPYDTAGTDISLAGRIVAVSDAYDVMTSTRSYKQAMSAEDGRAEIARCAGGQFDPVVTRAFLNVGLGRLRLTAGPLSWLGHTFGLETIPLTGAAAPVAAAATAASRALITALTIAGSAAVLDVAPPPEPPPAVAFVDDPAPVTIPAVTTSTVAPTTTTSTTTTIPNVATLFFDALTEKTTTTTAPPTTTSTPPTTTAAPTTTTPPTTVPVNARPVAIADHGPLFTTAEDTPFTTGNVATNDTDPEDGAADPASVTVVSSPANGVLTNKGDGTFAFAPALDWNGTATFTYTIVDSSGATSLPGTVTLSVTPRNDPPQMPALIPISADEGTTVSFTAVGSDPADSTDVLSFSLSGAAPTGAVIDSSTGVFSWTPSEAQDGVHSFDVVVTDDGVPAFSDSQVISITVNDVNAAPELVPVGNQAANEQQPMTFTATATDSDIPAGTLTFSLSGAVPAGALIDSSTGVFSWTPNAAQSGVYIFDVVVTDNGSPNLQALEAITVSVNETLTPPRLDPISNQSGDELTLISFTATASDSDLPANTLTFSLSGVEPAGAVIDSTTGVFSWTPTEGQDGLFTFDVVVTDSGVPAMSDSHTMTVTVNDMNSVPVLNPIADLSGNELSAITFTATASDADVPAGTLTFSLSGVVPAGAVIDSSTGVFSWTPTEGQDGVYSFDVEVTDDGAPVMSASQMVTVTVLEVNASPTLDPIANPSGDELTAITFTAAASDTDLVANNLTFSLTGFVPAGAVVDSSTGVFTWTPTEAQDGVHAFDVVVTDDGVPAMSDSQILMVAVNDVNSAPTLDPIADASVAELTAISFTATASDPDLPVDNLFFSLSGAVPAGAAIDPSTGVFTWTPTVLQTGVHSFDVVVTDDGVPVMSDSQTITLTVSDVNTAPTLDPIANPSGDELTAITFTATASDTDVPVDNLFFSLSGAVPAGAAIDPSTGVFTWTPTVLQTGVHSFDVVVTDDGAPVMSVNQTITLTVTDVNTAPTLDPIANPSGDELTAITFTATASDTDVPVDNLFFSLSGAVPAGAAIDPSTGVFSWTPAESQDGSFTFDVVVTDDGASPMAASQTITVNVNEVNVAPLLTAITDPSPAGFNAPFNLNLAASDSDITPQPLNFTSSGLPGWASLTDNGDGTATIGGTPPVGSLGTSSVTITVSDGVTTDFQTFDLDVTLAISAAAGDVVINELLFEQTPGVGEEFVELFNASAAPVDISGWRVASQNNAAGDPIDIDIALPATDDLGRSSILPAGGYAVIWLQTRGGTEVAPAAELEFSGGAGLKLDNDGEEIILYDPALAVVDYLEYGDRLNPAADFGTAPAGLLGLWDDTYNVANDLASSPGISLSLTANGVDGNSSACWEATTTGDASGRAECTGRPVTVDNDPTTRLASPGSDNTGPGLVKKVVVSEISSSGSGDFIELYNAGSTAVDIDTWRVRLNGSGTSDVTISQGGTPVVLDPGRHYLLVRSGTARAAAADQTFGFNLPANLGIRFDDGATVVDEVGTGTTSWFEGTALPPLPNGAVEQSYERLANGVDGNCVDTADNLADFTNRIGLLDAQNVLDSPVPCGSRPAASTVVISEFRPDGPGGAGDEFIEVFNPTGVLQDISGWDLYITEPGIFLDYYVFPGGTTLVPGEHFLVTRSSSPVSGNGTYSSIAYGAAWGDVLLRDQSDNVVDTLGYGDPAPGQLYEGAPLPSYSPITGDVSWERHDGGCADYNVNLIDFFVSWVASPEGLGDITTC